MTQARMPTALTAAELIDGFTSKVRARGQEYFHQGRVTLLQNAPRRIVAEVTGSEAYYSEIRLEDGRVDLICCCDAFRLYGPCKHIWAMILAADAVRERRSNSSPAKRKRPTVAAWVKQLNGLSTENLRHTPASNPVWPSDRRVAFVLQPNVGRDLVCVEVCSQRLNKQGVWNEPSRLQAYFSAWQSHPDPRQRQIGLQLAGGVGGVYYGSQGTYYVSEHNYAMILPELFRENACFWRDRERNVTSPIRWNGEPWQLRTRIACDNKEPTNLSFAACWQRGDEEISCFVENLQFAHGLLLHNGELSPADARDIELSRSFRRTGQISCRHEDVDRFVSMLLKIPAMPLPELPEAMKIDRATVAPRPRLKIEKPMYGGDNLRGELRFDYGDQIIAADEQSRALFDEKARTIFERNPQLEREFLEKLFEVGFKTPQFDYEPSLQIKTKQLGQAVAELTRQGWHVEADGKLFRSAGKFNVEVNSGIDWFDLSATVSYGDQVVGLPRLLAALNRGQSAVVLDDGTLGVLPETWLKQHAHLAGLGHAEGDQIRFKPTQVGLLDALIAAMPAANCDAAFDAARNRLKSFSGVTPVDAPETFTGELRPYQREGLGWLNFLREFQFGGCLADDMGLGKTIQVLAMLDSRRAQRLGPSLAVVPRSLVFNWKQEAVRFTPNLKVLDHTGTTRAKSIDGFAEHDLVLTTYGTLRRDAARFKDIQFDYVILDEAQAIKNASTESAKAARLLRGRHRLAMSGTPIENHLGELWSLIDFLNPGMLGSAGAFKNLAGASNADPEQAHRALLSKAVRPFILRRTKQQVASDLPKKTEQTIYCQLDAVQRKRYNELRDFYRAALMSRIESEGINKAKIVILEALLRLRQAACHPGLIDKSMVHQPSAKLDTLMDQLREVLDEGHKALVFSQFTSMLAIVRSRLDAAGIPYEYLDGQTRDRQARVERFQNDDNRKLFLISLKAGGVGLNLTSADYVFLLDPWWNPAVEAQAIDRAHRIGQTRSVFAYRLIAKDTVEEKVLELQNQKRDLADAIISQDNSLISKLTAADLRLLLS